VIGRKEEKTEKSAWGSLRKRERDADELSRRKVYDRKRHGGGDPVHAKPRISKLLERRRDSRDACLIIERGLSGSAGLGGRNANIRQPSK
jgi:hypothetical protein